MVIFFFLLLVFWFICSGYFSLFFVITGFLSAALTIVISKKLFIFSPIDSRFTLSFYFQLLKDMFISAYKVSKIIWFNLDEVKPICVLINSSNLNKQEQIIKANAITLTPGTMTLELKDNMILVHAINKSMLEGEN